MKMLQVEVKKKTSLYYGNESFLRKKKKKDGNSVWAE